MILECGRQLFEVALIRRHSVEPVRCAQVELERFAEGNVLHPEREDRDAVAESAFEFVLNGLRLIGVAAEDQRYGAAGCDGAHDLGRVGFAQSHVARRNPATDALALEIVTDGVCYGFVFARVAEENIVCHWFAAVVSLSGVTAGALRAAG